VVTKFQIDKLSSRIDEVAAMLIPQHRPKLYITYGEETAEDIMARHPELRGSDGKIKPMRTVRFD
jgi:hypothetical protein